MPLRTHERNWNNIFFIFSNDAIVSERSCCARSTGTVHCARHEEVEPVEDLIGITAGLEPHPQSQ